MTDYFIGLVWTTLLFVLICKVVLGTVSLVKRLLIVFKNFSLLLSFVPSKDRT